MGGGGGGGGAEGGMGGTTTITTAIAGGFAGAATGAIASTSASYIFITFALTITVANVDIITIRPLLLCSPRGPQTLPLSSTSCYCENHAMYHHECGY